MHRRTALSVSVALLAAAPLLSACSGETRPGTAAVVGGERITTSALQAQVGDVRAAQNRSEQAATLIANTPQLERIKLGKMIQLRVLERAAEDAGISVTTKEIEDARKAQEGDKGAAALEQLALQARVPLAPGQIDEDLRFRLLLDKLSERYGEEKIIEPLTKASEALHIEVNPRYGAWDAKQVGLGPADTAWITQRTRPEQEPAGA
ncbi:SurA N-terminal domain-containing protein [Streptomyces erythrochromogenes]|uniref:SurA N-terminal domain-containing protein n=1 Tax=Streptomyces erythrochromogenes TaxID=285574 RepID=UPI0037005859